MISRSLVLGALVACAGCNGAAAPRTGEASPEVVRVNDRVITVREVKARVAEQAPLVRTRYKTLERKKEFIENMVRFEVMLQEARRRGLENDPEVRSAVEKLLVQRLLRAKQEELEASGGPSDAAIKQHYEEHLAEFARPLRVRVAHLLLASPQGNPKRPSTKDEATRLVAALTAKSAGERRAAFSDLAKARSDDLASKSFGGDLGVRSREELEKLWGSTVTKAALDLQSPDELAGPVETDQGFHLLLLTSRQEEVSTPFEVAKARIAERLRLEARAQGLDGFAKELAGRAKVTVDERVLESIDFAEAPPPGP